MSNVGTVQAVYTAFGTGDVRAILAHVADDVDWEYSGGGQGAVAAETRRARGGRRLLREALARLSFTGFTPKEILDGGDVVVALIDVDVTVKATGKRIVEEDEIHGFEWMSWIASSDVLGHGHGIIWCYTDRCLLRFGRCLRTTNPSIGSQIRTSQVRILPGWHLRYLGCPASSERQR